MKVRIGTRGSDLALWQARHVKALLERAGAAVEIVVLETRGDRIDDVPLQTLEGKGFFTKEIEQALLDGAVDLAVHSHKDLPCADTPGLALAAVPERAGTGERLLLAPAAHAPSALFLPLAPGARVGTSAPRRGEQLLALRPDLELLTLRGNVPTRVRRLREGRYDAILLAEAGLERLALDLSDLVVVDLDPRHVVPAPAQGALAIQIRADDAAVRELVARALDDRAARERVAAERTVLVALGGGCNLPLGVTLLDEGGAVRAHAFLGAGHPTPTHRARWCSAVGATPLAAARALALRLEERGPTGEGPLGGLAVALAGSEHAGDALATRLELLGARVLRESVLEVEDVDGAALAPALARLRAGDALALTSANAARRLAGQQVPEGVRVAAVGPGTARALSAAGVRVDVVGQAGARELARELALTPGARVLFPCGEHALADLADELARRAVPVERVVLYRTRARADVALAPEADARVYLSPSAVDACRAWERAHAPRAARVALGAATAERLAAHGLPHHRSASPGVEDAVAVLAALVPEEDPS